MPRYEKDSLIQTDFGLARIVEPTEVILHNDEYMVQEMHETKNKMKSMEKYQLILIKINQETQKETQKMLTTNQMQ